MSGFVVDELIGEKSEYSYGIAFPEGSESFFFNHGGDAVSNGGVILFDPASGE